MQGVVFLEAHVSDFTNLSAWTMKRNEYIRLPMNVHVATRRCVTIKRVFSKRFVNNSSRFALCTAHGPARYVRMRTCEQENLSCLTSFTIEIAFGQLRLTSWSILIKNLMRRLWVVPRFKKVQQMR